MMIDTDAEERRLKVLDEYEILDTREEQIFDDITMLAAYICQTPTALISLVARDKQWFKSKVGLEARETPREIAFCHHAIGQPDLFTVNDALKDARFVDNPLVTGDPHVRFYTGAPITTPDGYALGTLCVIDREPRELSAAQQAALQALSRQVMNLLENRRARSEKLHLQASLDAERENLLANEKKARQLAEEASRLKDEFLATVSHELRTPLNAILGWAKLLDSGRLDADGTKRAVETIIRSAKSQAQLIEDLLDISRIISGKIRLSIAPVELAPVIRSAIDSLSLAAEAKSIRVETSIDPQAGKITGDAERLQQVFWNLLTNAIKFTPAGGEIKISLAEVDAHLEISVTDSGQGISPDFLPYIFERFRQADETGSRSSGGIGLGLAIVRHLVELHGGSIRAASPGEGEGSTFTVNLPLRANIPAARPAAKETAAEIIEETTPALAGIKAVIVDDEEDSRLLLREILAQSGAEVTVCTNVAETVEAVGRVSPHILISDIGMPDEDGYSLIRRVRALTAEQGGNTPAIALTAYTRVEDRVKVLSSGYQLFIPKPCEPAELLAAVESLAGIGKQVMKTN